MFPQTEIDTLIGYLRGRGGDLFDAIQAAVSIAKWAKNSFVNQPLTFACSPEQLKSDDELATELEALKTTEVANHRVGAVPAAAIPAWLVPILLNIAKRLLDRLTNR